MAAVYRLRMRHVLLPLLLYHLLLAVLVPAVSARANIEQVFDLAPGVKHGGCDRYKRVLQRHFVDSHRLIRVAVQRCAQKDPDSRAYLRNFFRVEPGDAAGQEAVCSRLRRVETFLLGSPPGVRGIAQPVTYCGEEWYARKAWTDVAYDRYTGEPRLDGKRIIDVLNAQNNLDNDLANTNVPYWDFYKRRYFIWYPDEAKLRCRHARHEGYSFYIHQADLIVLCMHIILRRSRPPTLDDLPRTVARLKPGGGVYDANPQVTTLFHEVFHVLLHPDDKDWAYSLEAILELDTTKALQNPESYVLYSLAVWLGTINPRLTYATGYGLPKSTLGPPSPALARTIESEPATNLTRHEITSAREQAQGPAV